MLVIRYVHHIYLIRLCCCNNTGLRSRSMHRCAMLCPCVTL